MWLMLEWSKNDGKNLRNTEIYINWSENDRMGADIDMDKCEHDKKGLNEPLSING